MRIEDEDWQVFTRSTEHKQQLLAYAAQRGVKVAHPVLGYATDADLFLNNWGPGIGIASLPARLRPDRKSHLISEELFRVLCDEHAQKSTL